ncbi:AbrB family transcriptional regulator [Actibacterium sp. 188UL27-1]|uniref:AbrB family transcriptional regulator n=1 Tax=Actibacterium sp. 188UL27-1 TaxID=2786961 RepID=UPI00195B4F64|nr:AbrB family transcriptional regulator [Actibacterium sp. 188UL27-1]MBM7066171.1 AbrB family transcriptional regulator [Actibacterium sp. 188UL27-1]
MAVAAHIRPAPGIPIIGALLVGLISGAVAARIGLPLPWMLGPMIGNTLAALARIPLSAPGNLRIIVIPIIGVMLGAGFSPDMAAQIASWGMTFALLIPFMVCAATVSFVIYRRIGGYDPVTAFFSAMPGGLNEMLILGDEAGGDGRRIALAHAGRILIVITCVALFFGLFLGVRGQNTDDAYVQFGDLTFIDGVILILCGIAGVWMGKVLRLPAATMLGPMILSAAVHLVPLVSVPPPTLLVIVAQIVIGTVIGCRFQGTTLAEIWGDLRLGFMASIAMIAVAVIFAGVIAALTQTDMAQAFLAFSPGGLTEMSLLAFAMGQDVAYVAVTHVVRIALVIFSTPFVFRLTRRYFSAAEAPKDRP